MRTAALAARGGISRGPVLPQELTFNLHAYDTLHVPSCIVLSAVYADPALRSGLVVV